METTTIEQKNTDYVLAVNHLSYRHHYQLKHVRKRKYAEGLNKTLPFPMKRSDDQPKPTEYDWRNKGIMLKVKDQAICWSFAAMGHLKAPQELYCTLGQNSTLVNFYRCFSFLYSSVSIYIHIVLTEANSSMMS